MSVRKVFSDEIGRELSYHTNSPNGELVIEISMTDGTETSIALEKNDAIQFIQELNKIRQELNKIRRGLL